MLAQVDAIRTAGYVRCIMKSIIPYAIVACVVLGMARGASAQAEPRRPAATISILRASANTPNEPGNRVGFAEYREVITPPPNKVVLAPSAIVNDEDVPLFIEASRLYISKIQPVMSNLCAGCHARRDHVSNFKLRPMQDGYVNQQAMEQNMRVAAKFVNRQTPASSLLLSKAVTAHGPAKEAPLYSRQHPAYQHLETWANSVAYPDGAPLKAPVASTAIPVNPNSIQAVSTSALAPKPTITILEPVQPPASVKPIVRSDFGSDQPRRLVLPAPNPEDPFDPATFNRLAHPPK